MTDKEHRVSETIFAKIIDGTIPCHRIYEDTDVLAFLDINPLSHGHTLLIPKESAETLGELSDRAAGALGRALPRVCRAVCRATGIRAYNVLQNNGSRAHQEVMYVHFHIIPKPDVARGLAVGWPAGNLDAEEGERIAATIREALKTEA